MKRLLGVALLLIAGSAVADDLADANRLLMQKSYDKALPLYQRLADAGNPEAQLRLGEMYWFGDGTAQNLGKAKLLFEKSAMAGNSDAASSLASLKRRETHGNEITYWTTTYNGADMISGEYACKVPELPALSQTKKQIIAVDAEINAYSACYNSFVDNLRAALPAGKRIPAEVINMMTPAEAERAQRHLGQVYAKLAVDGRRNAMAFTEQEAFWRKETEKFVMQDARDSARLRVASAYRSWQPGGDGNIVDPYVKH
jgi:TPR repeat protein